MVWTPKGSAPSTFRLRDEFVALITGDPTWGWLVDWLPAIPGEPQDTYEFCAAGPPVVPTLDPSWLMPGGLANPIARYVAAAAAGVFAGMAARDRVFGAFCELVQPLVGGWGPTHCWDSGSVGNWSAGGYKHTGIIVPTGATLMQFVSLTLYGSNSFGNLFYVEMTADGGTTRTYLETGNVSQAMSWTTSRQWSVTAGDELLCDSNAGWTGVFCIRFNIGEVTDHDPDDQPAPAGYVPALATAADLASIARELDIQEQKLDEILQHLRFTLRIDPLRPAGAIDDPLEIEEEEQMLVGDAVGVIIDIGGNTGPLSLMFGLPQRFQQLGRINFYSGGGFYASVELTHTPFVVRPLPPEVESVTVSELPPGVYTTIAFIHPAK